MTDITLEILEKRLHMTPSEIKRLSRESDLLGKTTELEKKLLLLESHGLLSNIPTDEKPDICSTPLFRCTYSELEFAVSVPELLSFSDEQRARYTARVIYWSYYSDIRDRVLSPLTRLCGSGEAENIVKELYISSYTSVSEDKLVEICSFLLGIPDPSKLLPGFISENWYSVFSVYSDPVSAVRMLEDVFEREHVIEVFTDSVSWLKIGYITHEPSVMQEIDKQWRNEVWEKAKEKFAAYLK